MSLSFKKNYINDNYFKKYKNLFNYSNSKFNVINNNIIYNFLFENKKICEYIFKYSLKQQIYENIILYDENNKKKYNYNPTLLFDNYVYNKYKNYKFSK